MTEWNLDRLLEMLDKEIAFLKAQNRELSKGTEALMKQLSEAEEAGP